MRLVPAISDPTVLLEAVGHALGTEIALHSPLDVDVYRLQRPSAGSDVVVRVVDDAVGRAPLDTVAGVLAALGETRFPAERCVGPTPVLTVAAAEGQRHLLLTEYVEPRPPPRPGFLLAWCTGLLARLATRPAEGLTAGGGWHRLGPTPSEEIDAALRLAEGLDPAVQPLLELLAEADDAAGLPETLIHADLTPPNAIARGEQPPVIVDWIGVGRGPRIWPLAFLLYAAGPRLTGRMLERYGRTITLTEAEWARLPDVMLARPLTLDLWSVAYERLTPRQALARCTGHQSRVRAIAEAVRAAR